MNDLDYFRESNWLERNEAAELLRAIGPVAPILHRHIKTLRTQEGARDHDLFRDMATAYESLRRLCISLHFDAGNHGPAFELETFESLEESD